MKISCVFLAFSTGGVTVAKEIVANADEIIFDMKWKEFQRTHGSYRTMFMTEKELDQYSEAIRYAKTKDHV